MGCVFLYSEGGTSMTLQEKIACTHRAPATEISMGMEVISIGFPHSALVGALLADAHYTPPESTATHITIPTGIVFAQEEFLAWKDALPCRDAARYVSTAHPALPTPVITQIKNFDLTYATPMDCMNFLAEIKKRLNCDLYNSDDYNNFKK